MKTVGINIFSFDYNQELVVSGKPSQVLICLDRSGASKSALVGWSAAEFTVQVAKVSSNCERSVVTKSDSLLRNRL